MNGKLSEKEMLELAARVNSWEKISDDREKKYLPYNCKTMIRGYVQPGDLKVEIFWSTDMHQTGLYSQDYSGIRVSLNNIEQVEIEKINPNEPEGGIASFGNKILKGFIEKEQVIKKEKELNDELERECQQEQAGNEIRKKFFRG